MMRIAVAVPACNEGATVTACIEALLYQSGPNIAVVVVFANNCVDDTVERLRARFGRDGRLDLREATLPAPYNHVGWARRLALDAAADHLVRPGDMLMTTDADTVVAPDWVTANVRHLERGSEIVAGAAHLARQGRSDLAQRHRRRLGQISRYFAALAYLKSAHAPNHDPWPRHDYEGGASIAMRLGTYRAIGGAPVLPTGEDRALFDAVRAIGGRVRHAVDARVFTSCRLSGRAQGGTADTLEHWGSLGEDEPAHGLPTLAAALAGEEGPCLSFGELEQETSRAQILIRAGRADLRRVA